LYRFCWFFFFIKKFSDAIFAHNIQWIFISLQSFFFCQISFSWKVHAWNCNSISFSAMYDVNGCISSNVVSFIPSGVYSVSSVNIPWLNTINKNSDYCFFSNKI
jgi:hypothetical protein